MTLGAAIMIKAVDTSCRHSLLLGMAVTVTGRSVVFTYRVIIRLVILINISIIYKLGPPKITSQSVSTITQ